MGGGLGVYGRAFWDIHLSGYQIGRSVYWDSSRISTYKEINWEIGDRTGDQSGYIDGEGIGVSGLALWDIHQSGDWDIHILVVLWDIY